MSKIFIYFLLGLLISCENIKKQDLSKLNIPDGMIWVESKSFLKGAKTNDQFAMNLEKPSHNVLVDGFFIDKTEVTNKQFKEFVNATNYITVAERELDWDEMKKNIPPGTEKPHDSIFQPGSLIFNKNVKSLNNINNYHAWWKWEVGANWKAPAGPGSSIKNKDNYPVVHITYEDALAYCKWANRRLPTEAEWESAAQGEYNDAIFTWGDNTNLISLNANTWQGNFPINNNGEDGFEMIAPVKSYPANSIGVFDMIGNVWEMTDDLYNINFYNELGSSKKINNPKGAERCYNPLIPYEIQYVMKGGSFLCHQSYCASYRISARMSFEMNSSSDHRGFRTVVTPQMLLNK